MHAYERDILDSGIARLKEILHQAGIDGELCPGEAQPGQDAVYSLASEEMRFYVEVKRSLYPHQVAGIADQYPQWLQDPQGTREDLLLVMAGDITKSAFDRCVELGLCVIAGNGNGYVRFRRFLYKQFVPGKQRPERSGPSSIFSAKASRLVRAFLCRYPEPWVQSELAEHAMVSPGYVSSLVSKMLDADYIRRDKKKLRVVAPDRLLDDWASRYRFDRHKRSRFAMSMGEYLQGLRKFQQEMRRQDIRFAFTGWSAAYLRSPYGVPDAIVAYVERLAAGMPFRALQPVESQGNVLLLLPQDEGVFQFVQEGEFGSMVADVQCYLDLLNLPGRAGEQAEVLREKRLGFSEVNHG
ncbi:MAG: type IV toxin-antitoxin system AbiEi family antitoxin [Kiritimatiellia bacterium]